MSDFVIPLLPAHGLAQSMLLPVLIGLYTVLLGTEMFGWVFAGAIVPGYLASVFTIQPVTGVIVIFESIVTLLISEAIAKWFSKTDSWTRFFGRERFFLIVMVSLIVRQHDQAWFAPWVIGQIDAYWHTTLETQQEFYSVGLVLVPLTANMLWKPPLHRGLMQLGVQVGVTYLIVAFVLLPHTNLSLSTVELTYEHAAVNFVGHAKAHMILLSAALLAAQFNLTYGWDFNGILVPALLALLWLTPFKLLATVSEGIVVFYLVKGFIKLPVIRHLDFEGPRKIVLVFTIAFLWKVLLGFTIGAALPDFKVSDAYGFGYLLSSLLAVKMIGVKSVRGVLLPSLTASAGGFVIGSMIGYLLDVIAPKPLPVEDLSRPQSTRLTASPLGVMTLARTHVELHREILDPPSAADVDRLVDFWRTAAKLGGNGGWSQVFGRETGIGPLQQLGADLGLQVVELGSVRVGIDDPQAPRREWLAIVADEGERWRGYTTGLLSPDGKGPVLVVPMPAREAPVAEVAALVCRRVDCRAVLVAGREHTRAGTRLKPRPIELAMRAFDVDEVVILRANLGRPERGYIDEMIAAVEGEGEVPEPVVVEDAGAKQARIYQLRGRLDTTNLWPSYELEWEPFEPLVQPPPGEQRSFVVLRATAAEYRNFLVEHAHEFETSVPREPPAFLDVAALPSVLNELYELREPPGTWGRGYRAPSRAELAVLEQLVVDPLMAWADAAQPGRPPGDIAIRAAQLDYQLVEFGDCTARTPCMVLLHERSRLTTAGWGTLVVRRQRNANKHVIEVPRPFRERETWRVGSELWQLLEARALLIAGADGLPRDPDAARDVAEAREAGHEGLSLAPNPDPVRPGNLRTPFQAIHQSLDRSARARLDLAAGERFEVAQMRGLASYRPITRDVIVGLGLPGIADQIDEACWSRLSPELGALVSRWDSCQIADGSEDLYLLSGAGLPQLGYSTELGNANVHVLWLSAGLRERYAAPRSAGVERGGVVGGLVQAGLLVKRSVADERGGSKFEIDTQVREVKALLDPMWSRTSEPTPDGRARIELGRAAFDEAIEAAVGYAETGNYHQLRKLARMNDVAVDLRVQAAIGLDFGLPVLIIEYVGEALGKRALIMLAPGLDGRITSSAAVLDDVLHLGAELLNRPQVLIITDKPIEGLDTP